MSNGVVVEGADRLARTLHGVARHLGNLAPTNAQAARVALAAGQARAPRRTGHLAGSGRATGTNAAGVITFGALYARVVNNGSPARGIPARPFATKGAEASQPAWIRLYDNRIGALLKEVKGA